MSVQYTDYTLEKAKWTRLEEMIKAGRSFSSSPYGGAMTPGNAGTKEN